MQYEVLDRGGVCEAVATKISRPQGDEIGSTPCGVAYCFQTHRGKDK